MTSRYCHLKCDPEMPTQKSRSVGGADGGASGAKGRALRGEIASRSAVDWLGRPTNGDYRALRNSGWRKDGHLVDRQMADGYLERREGADRRTNGRADGADRADSWTNAGVCETARRACGTDGQDQWYGPAKICGTARPRSVVRTAKICGTARPRSVVRTAKISGTDGQDQWYR